MTREAGLLLWICGPLRCRDDVVPQAVERCAALAAAEGIDGLKDTLVFSLASDGTDGPTDATGGVVTGETAGQMRDKGIVISDVLQNNDAYHALKEVDGLIITGPTGTNVNDISVLMIKK
jgi:hydroxypyruvate reductase